MEKKKITALVINKVYQSRSNNYKLEVINNNEQKIFFYSQKKDQETSEIIEINKKYSFVLFKTEKYWFLEKYESELTKENLTLLEKRKEEISNFNLNNLKEQAELKELDQLEKRLGNLREQIRLGNDEELIFLEYLEQFTNLLLIKQLSIKDNCGKELTKKEELERKILDKIVVNWFYKTPNRE